MSSAAEAEVRVLYINAKHDTPLRTTLIELGHIQPSTPMKTDNMTANRIMNNIIKQNRSKVINMCFYWLRDQVEQGQYNVFWAPGAVNLANYFTKHHSSAHHKHVRPIYLQTSDSPADLQGCIKILGTPKRKQSGAPNCAQYRPAKNDHIIASFN